MGFQPFSTQAQTPRQPHTLTQALTGWQVVVNHDQRAMRTLQWILLGLIVTGLVLAGVWLWQWQTQPETMATQLEQRLNGKVILSDGTHRIPMADDLQALSWQNGLAILDTLDVLNEQLTSIESDPNTPLQSVQSLRKTLRQQLEDRNLLEKTAQHYRISPLFRPEYQEDLDRTLKRYHQVMLSRPILPSESPTAPETTEVVMPDSPESTTP